eukprot:CCRYP_002443-RH/>CCRYP_002443-RH protein AED:0.49 eAED:0.92 QI:0/0/0/1/0/0/2/0/65
MMTPRGIRMQSNILWWAPIAITFLAVAGLPTELAASPPPELPAATRIKKSSFSYMNWSKFLAWDV